MTRCCEASGNRQPIQIFRNGMEKDGVCAQRSANIRDTIDFDILSANEQF